MRFVHNGPDIPDDLLFAHEDGRVVFFVGAGVSCPAGLPTFKKLINSIYEKLGVKPNILENIELNNMNFDRVLHLLQNRIPDGKERVRTGVFEILEEDHVSSSNTLHSSLLILSTGRKGKIRIVTTNFDRLFLESSESSNTEIFSAPALPLPSKGSWHGIVHLHGLLPSRVDEEALRNLVLTSGDFGSAYLSNGWATKFLVELFREHVICFVGYSMGDPMLKYWMDALSVNPQSGEISSSAYAFVSVRNPRILLDETRRWESMGVTPIPYLINGERNAPSHEALEATIDTWSEDYRDGVDGKRRVIEVHATNPPETLSPTSFANARVLWALTNERALDFFADIDPSPPITWLDVFEACGRNQTVSDLPGDAQEAVNSIRRQESAGSKSRDHGHRLWKVLVDQNADFEDNSLGRHLGRWICRHLDDPNLATKLASYKTYFNPILEQAIQSHLVELDEEADVQPVINREVGPSSNLNIRPVMRKIWNLFLTRRMDTFSGMSGYVQWNRNFIRYGYTLAVRQELRELLSPRITIRPSLMNMLYPVEAVEGDAIGSVVDWEAVTNRQVIFNNSVEISNHPRWTKSASAQLVDFTGLLSDLADLLAEIGASGGQSDLSTMVCPSIKKDGDLVSGREAWILIQLARDSWLQVAASDPAAATHWAEHWMTLPQPLFKRLALFAAEQKGVVPAGKAIDWLLSDSGKWLWSSAVENELRPLLRSIGIRADRKKLRALIAVILKGPPDPAFADDPADDVRSEGSKRAVASRLSWLWADVAEPDPELRAMIEEAGVTEFVSSDASNIYSFTFGYGSPQVEPPIPRAPAAKGGLVEWIRKYPDQPPIGTDDGWGSICTKQPREVAEILISVMEKGMASAYRLDSALRVWSLDKVVARKVWPVVAKSLAETLSPEHVRDISFGIGLWLHEVASSLGPEDAHNLVKIVNRLIDADLPVSETADPQESPRNAMDDSVGLSIGALLRWYESNMSDLDRDSIGRINSIVDRICDTSVISWRYGRIHLAWYLNALLQNVDTDLKKRIVSLLDWEDTPCLAQEMWIGLLAGPYLQTTTLHSLKYAILDTAKFVERLGEQSKDYASLLVEIAFQIQSVFSARELREATDRLACDDLEYSVWRITRIMESVDEKKKSNLWWKRVVPYFQKIWPNRKDLRTKTLSKWIAKLCLASPDNFEDGVKRFHMWLQPFSEWNFSAQRLLQLGLHKKCPQASLKFISKIYCRKIFGAVESLSSILEKILSDSPEVRDFPEYRNLVKDCDSSAECSN